LESLRLSILLCFVFIFVPGHAGVKENECAGMLAEKAVIAVVVQLIMSCFP
jgi:ribonuclease HI